MHTEQPKYQIGMTVAACLWLGAFPLLSGGTYTRLTADKRLIMLILCGVTLLCLLISLWESRLRKQRRRSPSVMPVGYMPAGEKAPAPFRAPLMLAGGLLLMMLLSCLFGGYGPDTWWLGASVRKEGLFAQLCYLGLFFAFALTRVSLKPVLYAAAAGVTGYTVIVLLQRAGLNPLGLYPAGRGYTPGAEFQGTIGNVDMVTGYLVMLSGLFLYGFLLALGRKKRKQRDLPLLFSCLAGLVLSVFLIVTMGVQFGIVTLAVLLLVTGFAFLPKKARLPALLLLIVLMLLVVWFWPGQSGGLWELHEILHGRARLSFGSNRVAVWVFSSSLAREENLLLGGGSDTFELRFNAYLRENSLTVPTEQDGVPLPDYFDTPHNEYLAHWLNHGLPAMLLFAALLLCAVFRRRDALLPLLSPASAAVLCYAVQAFFSFSVCIVAPMFWVVLGLSCSRS